MAKVKLGILGLGRGIMHVENALETEEAELIGACDWYPPRHQRAKALLARKGAKIKLCKEFDELLALKPDAVIVASNGRIQAEHSCRAMEAGCDVLSEVPGAFTVEEWLRIRETVERTGRSYMLGENGCFLAFLRYFRAWLMADYFGPISIAEAEYLHYLPQTIGMPDGSFMSPSEVKAAGRTDGRPIWRADQPPIQYLTHDLGPTLELLDDYAVSVTCRSAPWQCKETPLRSDGQIALFQTAKGTLVKILVTLSTRQPSAHRLRIMGTDGSAEWFSHEPYSRRLTRHADKKAGWERFEVPGAGPDEYTKAGHGGSDILLMKCFVKALSEKMPPPIDVYRAIEFSLPGMIANKSAESGGVPMSIPSLRRKPYEGTRFWDYVGLPEVTESGTKGSKRKGVSRHG